MEPEVPVDSRGAGPRECGSCSLCCTVLRVDALRKLGGCDCVHQRADGGCGIYHDRPSICREYRCLWLSGSLEPDDRPDRLGAILDLVTRGASVRLEIREGRAGNFDRSERLRAIAERARAQMPVRITNAEQVLDPDAPVRVLLADGEEQTIEGDRITHRRPGRADEVRRLPWIERAAEALRRRWLTHRVRGYRGAHSQTKR